MIIMKVLLNIILLPLLPLRLAWRWTGGAKASWTTKDRYGRDVVMKQGGCLPHVLGTLVIAGLLYAIIGVCIQKVMEVVAK